MTRRSHIVPALLLLVAARAGAVERAERPAEKAFTACHRYPESKRFRWGVRGEVGVAELVASLGEISGQALVVSPLVAARGGKVSLEVPDLLSASEVFDLFHSALEVMGLTVERTGKALKIVDAGRAKELATILKGEATPTGDQFVTRLLRIARAEVKEIGEVVTKSWRSRPPTAGRTWR